MKTGIQVYLSSLRELIDKKLLDLLPSSSEPVSKLEESMHYSILAGGKRLRPILCICASEAVGGSADKAIGVACAIEMIHTYSLIHDDLPSMDDDLLRRGIPTNHSVFGEALAILAGDALLTDAFSIIAGEGISNLLVPEVVVEIIGDISRAVGSQGMVGGQALDLAIEGKDVNVEFIEKVYRRKTGALIEASVISGARIGGATDDQLLQLRCYGKFLGLAFQIIDDILDIEGGTETGKNRGADARKNKATYPALVGVGEARKAADELTGKAVFALKDFDERAETLRELSFYLGGRKY